MEETNGWEEKVDIEKRYRVFMPLQVTALFKSHVLSNPKLSLNSALVGFL